MRRAMQGILNNIGHKGRQFKLVSDGETLFGKGTPEDEAFEGGETIDLVLL
jgi:hypothetical protein